MLSDSIKYQDLRSEKHTYKSEIGSKRIKKILILNSGRFFAVLNNTCKSAGTLVLLLHIRRHGRIENPYTQFRQIFRCAQQHVQISRHISLVATYPSAREISRHNSVVATYPSARVLYYRVCHVRSLMLRTWQILVIKAFPFLLHVTDRDVFHLYVN